MALRSRINECFELAALPGTTLEQRNKLLTFCVVCDSKPLLCRRCATYQFLVLVMVCSWALLLGAPFDTCCSEHRSAAGPQASKQQPKCTTWLLMIC